MGGGFLLDEAWPSEFVRILVWCGDFLEAILSDNPTPNDMPSVSAEASAEVEPSDGGFEAITSQDQLDRILSKRLERERAKYADYDELKAKAAEAADSRTEVEKLTDRIAQLEQERHRSALEAAKAKAASEYGVPADLLVGDDEEAIGSYAQRLAEYVAAQAPKAGAYVKNVGRDDNESSAEAYARRMLSGE